MRKIKQAVILAGGQGTRLRPLTNNTPKPLIPINGKPFVQYILENLKENNIREVVFLVGYLGDKIEEYFGDGSKFGLKISYSYSPIEFDTGSRIREARKLFDDTFLLLFCDNYWPLDLKELLKFYNNVGTPASVTIYKNFYNYTINKIKVTDKNLVEIYDKTGKSAGLNGVDIGYFILKKNLLRNLPKENFSFEKVIMQKLITEKQLAGFMSSHKYYGLSNLERIQDIENYFKPKNVIFLDRDGIINKKPPRADYVKSWDEFHLLPHALEALKLLTKQNYDIYIVTNQAGIGRGMMTEKDLQTIHKNFLKICNDNGITIKQIYFCPHDWNTNCECRKPKPGMFFQAAAEHNFDLTKALFIGDDDRDKIAGEVAGCKTYLMKPNSSLLKKVKSIVDPRILI
ncbi:MAG TPA: HAD-IIIA family hydrolase [Candidatus Acidoferrales bacterium]|nr:HAD-IIIA family hydrolase [Candidatus Acidoferrales bacterium]